MRQVPNALTLAEVALGFFQLAALMSGRADLVPGLLCAALLADYLAGRLARGRSLSSGIGAELDALASLMAFAIGPLVYATEVGGLPGLAALAGAVAAALRLSRDNASSPDWPRYQGLPVPAFGLGVALSVGAGAAGHLVTVLTLVLAAAMLAPFKWRRIESRGRWLFALALLMALGMVSVWARDVILIGALAYALAGAKA